MGSWNQSQASGGEYWSCCRVFLLVDEEAGVFLHQQFVMFEACLQGHWLCSTSILPWAPAKCVLLDSYRCLQQAALGSVEGGGGYVGMSISSVAGAYNHREGSQVHPWESLQSWVQWKAHCSFGVLVHMSGGWILKNFSLCLIQSANHIITWTSSLLA